MGRIIAIAAWGCMLAGCSSSLPSMDFFKSSPSTETLRVESEPPGAEAKTTSGQACKTPCELTVQPGSDQSITLALNGYQPHTVALRQEGGDTGKLAPNPVFVELKSAAPAPAKKKKTAAAKKKPTTTAAVATPTTTAAATAPAPAAPAAEPPAAANNSYPWSNPR